MIIQGKRDIPEWWDAPFVYSSYDTEVCKKCAYSNSISNTTVCMYIHYMDERRPCKAGYCVIEGVWKPKKKVRSETIEKIRKGYVINGEKYKPISKGRKPKKNDN